MNTKKIFFLILFTSLFSSNILANTPNNKISLQLLWKNQFEFAGFYMAKEKGFYKDEGLDVDIKEYNYGINIVQDVMEGKSDIGISRTSLILEKLKGKDLSLLFSVFQSSPYVLISNKRDDLESIGDFKDKKIMYSDDLESIAAISAMLKIGNIKGDDLIKIPHSFHIEDVMNGKVDLMSVYRTNEPFSYIKKDLNFKLFDPKDYGFNFYADIVFTSNNYIKNNEQKIKKFIRASKKGWEYALNHIEQSAAIIYKKYNTQNKSIEALIYEGKISKDLILEDGVEFGSIDMLRIKEIANLYKLLGLTKESNEKLENIIYNPYKFLNTLTHLFSWKLFLALVLFICFIVFLFLYRQYILKKQNLNLENLVNEKTLELQKLNQNLELEVQQRTQELQTQKDELKTLFEQSKDGLAILDLDSNFLEFNDSYLAMTGYTKEELYQKTCYQMTKDDEKAKIQNLLEVIKTKGYITNFEKTCIKKDGSEYIVNITHTLLPDKQRILISVKDITLIKEKERILFEQSKMASLAEMIANVAHQWRQPLSGISISATSTIVKKEMNILDDKELKTILENINNQVQYLSKTIDTFQNYINPNKEYIACNIDKFVEEALVLLSPILEDKKIQLVKSLNSNDLQSKIPEGEFIEIIFNIINNAKDQLIKNNNENKWIKVETKVDNKYVSLTIEDNGGGIPQDILNKIFEPYFTTKHQSQGTGLGLYMCYEIITKSLKGSIEVNNTKNGALFTIKVPYISED